MINKLFHSKVFKNGLWLTLLQVFNTIAPMITIPYITRVLGATKYGTFSKALNLIYYIQVIVEYGFAMSGARKVALNNKQEEINKTYSSIFCCRILLTLISAIILCGVAYFGNYDKTTIICMILLFIIVIGTTIQLTWLFQGMQDMRPVTIVSMISRLVSLLLIFLLVKDKSDLYLYCIFYSLTNIIFGIVGQIIARKKYNIKFYFVSLNTLIEELKGGWYLFTSSAMSKIFGNIGVTILGLVASDYYVGIYSAISKITTVAILLFLPVSQALFPHMSQLFETSKTNAIKLLKKVALIVVSVFLVGSIGVFIFRDLVVKIAFGEEYVAYSLLLLPLLIWMMASIINNFLGIQILVASGKQKQYSQAFFISMCFLIIYNLFFAKYFKIFGVAIAQAVSELTLSIFLCFYIIKSYKNNENNFSEE